MNLEEQIKSLGPWYQKLDIEGISTINEGEEHFKNITPYNIWDKISKFFIDGIKRSRILDIGSNAGFHSINLSLLGAKEVIGVEIDNKFYRQAQFYKSYIENKNNVKLNVEFIKRDISALDFDELGDFNYVLALSVIYHIGKYKYGKYTDESVEEQIRVLNEIGMHTNYFIVGTRNNSNNDIDHYTFLFNEVGFELLNKVIGGKRNWALFGKR